MKQLNDLSVFQWEKLPPVALFRGMETWHIRSRRSYRMHTVNVGTGVDDLLATECFCEVQWRRGARYRRRGASFLSIEYILSGEVLARQENRGYLLGPGEIFLMQPGGENELFCTGPGCHKISLMIVGKMLTEFLDRSGLGSIDVVTRPDHHHIERMLRQIGEFAEEGGKASPERNALLTYELLQYLRTTPGEPDLPESLTLLRDALEQHPEYEWSQREMARQCNCTPTHLGRIFRKHFNTTPYRMLMELRIERARQLLTREELSIKEISGMVGYTNPLNFSTEFRKKTGMSPREYRNHISWLS